MLAKGVTALQVRLCWFRGALPLNRLLGTAERRQRRFFERLP